MKLGYAGILLIIGVSWGADYTLDPKKRLEVPISKTSLTRIFVEGDRIHQVFGIDGIYILETEEEMGQIFIKPVDEMSETPFTLTLLTEEGVTQDLLVKPRSGIQESIGLKPHGRLKKKPQALASVEHGEREAPSHVFHVLRKIKLALSPQWSDFFELLEGGDVSSFVQDGLHPILIKRMQDESHVIEIWKLKNRLPRPQALTLESFCQAGDVALALTRKEIPPYRAALFVRVRLRREE